MEAISEALRGKQARMKPIIQQMVSRLAKIVDYFR